MHGNTSLPKNFRSGNCMTCAQFYSLMKADVTRVLDIDIFKSGDDPENKRTATLWETDIEGVGSDVICWNFLYFRTLYVISRVTLTALIY